MAHFERQNSSLYKEFSVIFNLERPPSLLPSSRPTLGPLTPVDGKGKEALRRQSHKIKEGVRSACFKHRAFQREASVRFHASLCYRIADDVDAYGRSLAAVGEGAGILSAVRVLLAAASPTSAVGESDVIEEDFFIEIGIVFNKPPLMQ